MRVDLADAKWCTAMNTQSVSRVFTHHVTVDEEQQATSITDDMSLVSWKARDGRLVPSLVQGAARFQGRVIELGRRTVVACGQMPGSC